MVVRSFTQINVGTGALGNYTWFFDTPGNVTVFERTFLTAGIVTGVCLAVGYPYAYMLTVLKPRWRIAAIAVVLVPFWTSLMVRNFAWVVILQSNHGVLNDILGGLGLGRLQLLGSISGVIIGMSQILLPFFILPLYATLRGIDRSLLLAAQSLGARPSAAMRRIYLPLSMPGVVAGCLLVFVLSLGFYITPAMLGSPQQALLSQLIVTQVETLLDWGTGGAMAVILLVVTFALLGVAWAVSRRGSVTGGTARVSGGAHLIAPAGRAATISLRVATTIVAIWLVAPILVVIPTSFEGNTSFAFPPTALSLRWYSAFFSNPQWSAALVSSLKIAAIVTVVATVMGTGAALGLSRCRRFARAPITAALLLPMIVPSVIFAVGVYSVFLQWHLIGTTLGFVLAHTCVALPFVVVTVTASLRGLDRRLEDAAATLGATPLRTFWQVTAPLIRPGIVTGALFAFVASFDELVVALFLVDPTLRTLPVQMYTSVVVQPDPTVAVASTLIFMTTLAVLVGALLVSRGRLMRRAYAT